VTAAAVLGGAAVVLAVAGNVPAIRATWRGTFNPQVLSWAGWAGIMLLGGGGTWAASPASAGYVLACAGGCLAVAVLALRTPASKREPPVRVPIGRRRVRLDLVCLPGAVAGLVLLAVVRAPGWAVGVSVATDAVLYVPTFADGWRAPDGQPLLAYRLFAAGGAAATAAVLVKSPAGLFAALAYPVYLLAADGAMSLLVAARRRELIRPARCFSIIDDETPTD
jgi:hypothetical protein